MTINDSDALSVAVRSGYGVAQIQDYYVDDAIVAGELEAVLAKFDPTPTPISLVYPPTRHLSPKMRALLIS
jgi:DNA-binding transcriptional LysR family regulator